MTNPALACCYYVKMDGSSTETVIAPPFLKRPFVDENQIFHYFAYISDEAAAKYNVEDMLFLAQIHYNQYVKDEGLVLTESVAGSKHLNKYAVTEYEYKAGVI